MSERILFASSACGPEVSWSRMSKEESIVEEICGGRRGVNVVVVVRMKAAASEGSGMLDGITVALMESRVERAERVVWRTRLVPERVYQV